MKNFSKTLTLQEATEMFRSDSGMEFVDTPHNRDIVKQVVDSHLKSIRTIPTEETILKIIR